MSDNGAILKVDDLVKYFPVTAGVMGKTVAHVKAVDGVSLELKRGETLGLVGESGCGKTTLGRSILRLIEPTSGTITFEGTDLTHLPYRELRPFRRNMQIIFQDPFSSLNPRMTVLEIVGESLRVHGLAKGKEVEARVHDLLRKVGLPGAWINRYPHEFSGGQRQRIGIARAIALNPKFIVCDEPVSALDVSVQAQVLNLLIRLREELDLSYLFIAHNLAVVKHISNRVAVMYLGQIVETASSAHLFDEAVHPYTLALLSAIPSVDPQRRSIHVPLEGDVPTPLNPPSGCRFHTRCPAVMERCRREEPRTVDLGGGHGAKCFLSYDLESGPDWRRRVLEKMDRAVAENRKQKPDLGTVGKPEDRKPKAVGAASSLMAQAPELSHRRIESNFPVRLPAGIAIAALGVFSILWIAPSVGTALLVAAFGFLLLPGSKRKLVVAAAFVLTLVCCLWVRTGIEAVDKRFEARRQSEALQVHIEQYRETTGRHPASLKDLRWRLHETFRDGKAKDPWGNKWLYTVSEQDDGVVYEVRGAGPDGDFDNADDIVLSNSETPQVADRKL